MKACRGQPHKNEKGAGRQPGYHVLYPLSTRSNRSYIALHSPSPITGVTASVPLYAEDDRGRCFAIQHCDWRGPNVRTDAAIFDTLHYACRDKGLPEAEFPEVYLIHLTDYDLGRRGEPILRLDHSEDEMKDLTPEEWRLRGCDPNEPEPLMTKFHVILFNATIAAG